MAEVRDRGLIAARRLEGDIWEVRIDGDRMIYRARSAITGASSRRIRTTSAARPRSCNRNWRESVTYLFEFGALMAPRDCGPSCRTGPRSPV
jgi:hypothetical protein